MAEKLHRQQRRWSYWSRALAVAVGICVALVLSGYASSSAAEARSSMRSILDAISNESAAVTNEYLAGPETAAEVVAGMRASADIDPDFEQALFTNLIKATSQIEAVFVGFPDGTFNFVARSERDDSTFRIRTIEGPERLMTESFATSDLTPVSSEPLPESVYDPRERAWFEPIAAGAESTWTEPYVFESSGKLGVTYSVSVRDDRNELVAVVGVDLTLDELVTFLKDRRPSENGSAQVVNSAGLVLAGSETDVVAMSDPDAELPSMPIASSVIRNAMTANGVSPINERFTDGDRWGNIREVSQAERGWYLLVESPRHDFDAGPQQLLSGQTAQILLWSLLTSALAYGFLVAGGRRFLQLNSMANIDELTSLLNRSGIFRDLGAMLSSPGSSGSSADVVVAIIDLDRFKAVNDSFGHAVGDQALTQAALKLALIVDRYDMQCGRLGGDEFVVFGQLDDHLSMEPMWNEIREAITSLSRVGGAEVDLSASIGVAAFPRAIPIEVTAALHFADQGLYAAKRRGGDVTVFSVHEFSATNGHGDPSLFIIDAAEELANR